MQMFKWQKTEEKCVYLPWQIKVDYPIQSITFACNNSPLLCVVTVLWSISHNTLLRGEPILLLVIQV